MFLLKSRLIEGAFVDLLGFKKYRFSKLQVRCTFDSKVSNLRRTLPRAQKVSRLDLSELHLNNLIVDGEVC